MILKIIHDACLQCEVPLRDCLLGLLSWVYLWAFASLYYQIPGLYGDTGLLPVHAKLNCRSCNFE